MLEGQVRNERTCIMHGARRTNVVMVEILHAKDTYLGSNSGYTMMGILPV